eukprot:scaffold289208_cov20-Prasinocladus_malaysianus.AAC.1
MGRPLTLLAAPLVLFDDVHCRSVCCMSQLRGWWGSLRYLRKSCESCGENVLRSRRCQCCQ